MLFDDNLEFWEFTVPKKYLEHGEDKDKIMKGFYKGTLFKEEYMPYKNYMPSKIIPRSEEESLLLEVMALSFALNDLNLYLDLHPKDEKYLEKFRKISQKYADKNREYVKKYGPLEITDSTYLGKFKWIDNPWPWQNIGGSKYV